jgi:hypothetical protein
MHAVKPLLEGTPCVFGNARKSALSVAAKQREKVKRKRAFAESWKRYQAKQKAAASA